MTSLMMHILHMSNAYDNQGPSRGGASSSSSAYQAVPDLNRNDSLHAASVFHQTYGRSAPWPPQPHGALQEDTSHEAGQSSSASYAPTVDRPWQDTDSMGSFYQPTRADPYRYAYGVPISTGNSNRVASSSSYHQTLADLPMAAPSTTLPSLASDATSESSRIRDAGEYAPFSLGISVLQEPGSYPHRAQHSTVTPPIGSGSAMGASAPSSSRHSLPAVSRAPSDPMIHRHFSMANWPGSLQARGSTGSLGYSTQGSTASSSSFQISSGLPFSGSGFRSQESTVSSSGASGRSYSGDSSDLARRSPPRELVGSRAGLTISQIDGLASELAHLSPEEKRKRDAQVVASVRARQHPGLPEVDAACDFCRKRKLKCDRVKPKCGKCAKLGKACVITDTLKKRGPPTNAQKAMLEAAGVEYTSRRRRQKSAQTQSDQHGGISSPEPLVKSKPRGRAPSNVSDSSLFSGASPQSALLSPTFLPPGQQYPWPASSDSMSAEQSTVARQQLNQQESYVAGQAGQRASIVSASSYSSSGRSWEDQQHTATASPAFHAASVSQQFSSSLPAYPADHPLRLSTTHDEPLPGFGSLAGDPQHFQYTSGGRS